MLPWLPVGAVGRGCLLASADLQVYGITVYSVSVQGRGVEEWGTGQTNKRASQLSPSQLSQRARLQCGRVQSPPKRSSPASQANETKAPDALDPPRSSTEHRRLRNLRTAASRDQSHCPSQPAAAALQSHAYASCTPTLHPRAPYDVVIVPDHVGALER